MRLTDTHCHLDLDRFDHDRQDVIQRAHQAGVSRILIPALGLESSRRVTKLASSHPILYSAIGVHPTEAGKWDEESRDALVEIAQASADLSIDSGKIVAVGEIGLDYYWDSAPHDLQRKILGEQLAIASDLGLPVILHSRENADSEQGDCAEDLLELLEVWTSNLGKTSNDLISMPGVLHSFSGSLDTARHAIAMNFCIGVTGPITYKNANRRREIIASLPLERLLIETDSPFQAPHPHRGDRNEPGYVTYIADKIAEIHMTTPDQVAKITSENAARLFGWGG